MTFKNVLSFEPREVRNVKKRQERVMREMKGTLPVLEDLRKFLIGIVERIDALHTKVSNSIQLMEGGDN